MCVLTRIEILSASDTIDSDSIVMSSSGSTFLFVFVSLSVSGFRGIVFEAIAGDMMFDAFGMIGDGDNTIRRRSENEHCSNDRTLQRFPCWR